MLCRRGGGRPSSTRCPCAARRWSPSLTDPACMPAAAARSCGLWCRCGPGRGREARAVDQLLPPEAEAPQSAPRLSSATGRQARSEQAPLARHAQGRSCSPHVHRHREPSRRNPRGVRARRRVCRCGWVTSPVSSHRQQRQGAGAGSRHRGVGASAAGAAADWPKQVERFQVLPPPRRRLIAAKRGHSAHHRRATLRAF